VLHPRFQVAIDKAASRAGKRAYNDYIEEWRKVARACSDEVEAEVTAEVERLETEYDRHRLAELIQSGGVQGGPALPPAGDETSGRRAPDEAEEA
jgi:Virulence factor